MEPLHGYYSIPRAGIGSPVQVPLPSQWGCEEGIGDPSHLDGFSSITLFLSTPPTKEAMPTAAVGFCQDFPHVHKEERPSLSHVHSLGTIPFERPVTPPSQKGLGAGVAWVAELLLQQVFLNSPLEDLWIIWP